MTTATATTQRTRDEIISVLRENNYHVEDGQISTKHSGKPGWRIADLSDDHVNIRYLSSVDHAFKCDELRTMCENKGVPYRESQYYRSNNVVEGLEAQATRLNEIATRLRGAK